MSRRLNENLSSLYFEAANKLNSKSARQKIVAYVESYDDVFFWRSVLSDFENEHRYFEVMLPSRLTLTKGKKQVLMNLLEERVGDNMIACVDADYDYLLQGATAVSEKIIHSRYVFHTYVYAIENYQCYAPSLHNVCVMVTLNDHALFDFVDYLTKFSEAIFPLFVWNIWVYRNTHYGEFTITDFNRVIETGNFNLQNPDAVIAHVRHKVGRKVQMLQRAHPNAKESWLKLKEELKALGVTPQTTYLYIQGHHLFDNVVVPMLKRICDLLIRERENEIYSKAAHTVQKHNEMSCYTHSLADITQMLKKNMGYQRSEPYKRLCRDLERLFGDQPEESADGR